LQAPDTQLFPWNPQSTYIKRPPFFEKMVKLVLKIILKLKVCFIFYKLFYFFRNWSLIPSRR
jgi:aconitase A